MNNLNVGDFKFIKTLEHGSIGKIKYAIHMPTSQEVAVKVIKKDALIKTYKARATSIINREVDNIRICSTHPGIVKLLDFIDEKDTYYIIMEYIPGGDLHTLLIKDKCEFTSEQSQWIIQQLISCVEYCHGNFVAHRDLKLENIMVTNPETLQIKLIDFGLSCVMRREDLHSTFCGTLEYCAPEILKGIEYHPVRIDIWALGVVAFIIVNNFYPFDGTNSEIIRCVGEISYTAAGTESFQDLCQKIFTPHNTRASIYSIKQHPWFSKKFDDALPLYSKVAEPQAEIIKQVVMLGYFENEVVNAVKSGISAAETAIYWKLSCSSLA